MPEVVDAFDAVARAQPEATAITARGAVLSFAELARASEELAARLVAAGVREGDVVALSLGRTVHHVVAILAAWRAGAAFFPVDEGAPSARVRAMLAEARVRAVLTVAGGDRGVDVERCADDAPPLGAPADALAYVVYTSGSTGAPKGVRVSHRGLATLLRAQIAAFGLRRGKRALLALSTAFDASISDIGTSLLSGATLVVADGVPPPTRLAEVLRAHAITHADLPPALLPRVDPSALPPSFEAVVIGGEVCPPAAVRAWARRVRVVNVYGPTEATICTSLCVCRDVDWDAPLIGDPIEGVEYDVVDGELLIAGPCLALGYVDRPRIEAERFVVREGKRWYRTGDGVRAHAGGLAFVGRLDRQFKLHGRLVCPEEIEARLRSMGGVADAAVVVDRHETVGGGERAAVTAFVVPGPGAPAVDVVRERLAESLPRWMLPRIVFVASLARGIAGKVDRAALAPHDARESMAPRVRVLADAFAEVLELADVGSADDVVELGGDSLAAVEIAARVQLAGVFVEPSTVLVARTPAAIAAAAPLLPPTTAALEARTDPLVQQAARPSSAPARGTRRGPDWLVTGATGFLGRRLLPALLARTAATGARIHCLVRAASDDDARARLGSIAGADRIVAHAGDVSARSMGLADGDWRALSREVGNVVHAAAAVSVALPFEALEAANVRGAVEVARFVHAGADKTLHHVSSLAVLASTDTSAAVIDERTVLGPEARVVGGYAQTKYVAERLLRRAVPGLRVVRPGLLTGDATTGEAAATCPLHAFLRALAAIGCVPPADVDGLRVDVTPIDHAARAIADVVTSPRAEPVVHVASEIGASFGDLVSAVREHADVAEVSREAFLRAARARLPRGSALALVAASSRLLQDGVAGEADLFLHTGRRFPGLVLASVTGYGAPAIDRALLGLYAARAASGVAAPERSA